ncbi:hypothetical protein BVY03_01910 [bacterium K02(2017)]|nr:hypothetical protein BVY03_01910 [bacterium K02(2017)]
MKENLGVKTHRQFIMGRRVKKISQNIAKLMPESINSVLDVGAGTGEMANSVNKFRPQISISGVDVYIRPKTFVPIVKYDGTTLPFEDNSFDAVMTVDVLHHCNDPVATLKECARVASQYVIIKDHVSSNYCNTQILRFMDWVGNRSHGVVLPYNYLSTSQWDEAFTETGLKSITNITKLNLYPFPLDFIFGGSLHCLHLLKKTPAPNNS